MSDDPYQPSVDVSQGVRESELELTARLLRALSHRIRGDLSVVTNDLVYLSSLVDPAELERPRARCASIASALSSLGLLTSTSGRERRALVLLSEIFGLTLESSIEPSCGVVFDEGLMKQAAQLLQKLLGSWSGSIHGASDPAPGVVCTLRFEQPRCLKRSYSSVGQMVAAELGERFVVEACIVDVLLRDHGWCVRFIHGGDRAVCEIAVNECLG